MTTVLLRRAGFGFGVGGFDLKTLLFEPINGGHHYMLIAPGWFIPTLFLLEVCNVYGRKLLGKFKLDNEYAIMVLYLVLGLACVWLAKRGSVYDYYRIPARLMFMAPVFQFGRLYKVKLESDKKYVPCVMVTIAIIINIILHFTQIGLAFSAVWVSGFAGGIWLPYLTIFSGIMLWLGVSKIIDSSLAGKVGTCVKNSICYIGSHTFSICMLHLSAFFVMNTVLAKMDLNGFDYERYMSDVYYAYSGFGNAFMLIYVVIGLITSLALCWCVYRIRSFVCGLQITGKIMK